MTHPQDLMQNLEQLNAPQLRRLLTEHLTKQKLGLYWESSAIERDAALNANIVLPRLVKENSHNLSDVAGTGTPNLNSVGALRQHLHPSRTTAHTHRPQRHVDRGPCTGAGLHLGDRQRSGISPGTGPAGRKLADCGKRPFFAK